MAWKPSTASPSTPKLAVIACELAAATRQTIHTYADDLRSAAHSVGSHGLSVQAFEEAGLFRAAIERLRGQQAASMGHKRAFLEEVLGYLVLGKHVQSFKYTGQGDRHDFQVLLNNGNTSVFEAKGCLDGNNTNIWIRPPNANEFLNWSLCQNAGADPRKNAWSGIHTRLGPTIIAEKKVVEGLVIWDQVCGTIGRPCPKLANSARATVLPSERRVPPPCIYLFPQTVPDPRSNPRPNVTSIAQVGLLEALYLPSVATTMMCAKYTSSAV